MQQDNKLRFYIFRHGETELNKQGKIQGQIESALTALGKMQAVDLAKKYDNIHLDCIFSSPLSRCIETAMQIAKDKNICIEICEELKEAFCGDWEGLPLILINTDEDNIILRKKYLSGQKIYSDISYPGGEKIKDVQKRFSQALEKIISTLDNNSKKIGISTHSIVMRHFFALITDKELSKLDNAQTLIFEYDLYKSKWTYISTF